jgi:flagellar motor switch protein FliM
VLSCLCYASAGSFQIPYRIAFFFCDCLFGGGGEKIKVRRDNEKRARDKGTKEIIPL